MEYRISVQAALSFTIVADSEESAIEKAMDYTDTFCGGVSVGPNDGSDASYGASSAMMFASSSDEPVITGTFRD